jgi:hypothetical protein
LGISSHGIAAERPEVGTRVRSPFVTSAHAMPQCIDSFQNSSGDYINDKLIQKVVRVIIPASFILANPQPQILAATPLGLTTEYSNDSGSNGTPVNTTPDDPFYFNISNLNVRYSIASDDDTTYYVEVRVILQDSDFKFYSGSEDKIWAIAVGDNNLGQCGLLKDKKSGAAVFFIPFKKVYDDATGKAVGRSDGSYNIGLVPIKATETPFFIDPHIGDSGT